jgi:hypothetical protein
MPVILATQEGRNQKDRGSKAAQTNSPRDPILKNLHKNRAGGVAQCEGPEFKPQYQEKKKKARCRATCLSPQILRRLRQDEFEFKVSPDYTARHCLTGPHQKGLRLHYSDGNTT